MNIDHAHLDSLLLRVIRICFAVLLFATPLIFAFDTKELFEFNKMLAVYALTTLIATAWLGRMIAQKKFVFNPTPLDIPILLFLLSQLVSTLLSIHPRTSILGYYTRYNGGLLSTLSYVILYFSFVTHLKKKDLLPLFGALLTGSILVSLYAIPEHFGYSMSCLLAAPNHAFNVSCWVQDVQSRVFATFGQPNWLAAYIITILPLSFVLSSTVKKPSLQKIFSVTTLLLFTTLLFTRSRSGLVGLGVGAVVMSAGFWLRAWLPRKTGALLTGGILIIALIFGTIYTPTLFDLFSRQNSQPVETQVEATPVVNRLEEGGTDSGEIRKIVWEGAISVWKRYPWFGSGVETFGYSYYLDRPAAHNMVSEWDFLYNKAHNEFLNYLATTGLFGLGSYLFLLASFSWLILKTILSKETSTNTALRSTALFSGFSALMVSNFFGFSTVMVSVIMYFFFAAAAINFQSEKKTDKLLTGKLNLLSQAGLLITIITGGVILMLIARTRQADVAYAIGKSQLDAQAYEVGLANLAKAIKLAPREAQYYDTLSSNYARLAVALSEQKEASAATQFAESAISLSDQAIALNPEQRNFYKTRAQVFIILSQLEPTALEDARAALQLGFEKSPTDAKLLYNLALTELSLGLPEEAIEHLRETVALKPDYEQVRLELGNQLQQQGDILGAKAEFEYILSNLQPNNEIAQEKLTELEKTDAK